MNKKIRDLYFPKNYINFVFAQLERLTVAVLKDYLSSQGIGRLASKKKSELIDLVKHHLGLN